MTDFIGYWSFMKIKAYRMTHRSKRTEEGHHQLPPADDTLHADVYIAERFSEVDGNP